ncbi:MAG TPA: hypothetical protein VFJ08_03580, partial [Salinisphaera sp.]
MTSKITTAIAIATAAGLLAACTTFPATAQTDRRPGGDASPRQGAQQAGPSTGKAGSWTETGPAAT